MPRTFHLLRRQRFRADASGGGGGIPTLGLFGPSLEEHYAPWGPWGAAVRADKSFDEIFPSDFDHRETGTLMDSLAVDVVEEAARELWRRASEDAA